MSVTGKVRTERGEKRPLSLGMFFGLLSLLILIAAFLFINSSYFKVGNVVVKGNKYLTVEEVYRIANVPEDVNIFRLNAAEIKNRLTSDLRIASVDVSRHFPATIQIVLTERRPVAILASGLGFVEVDKQGIILVVHKNIKQIDAPMITGVRLGNVYVGDKVEDLQVKQVLIFLSFLDEASVNQLSEVNVNNDRLMIYTINSTSIRLGNMERLEEKAKLLAGILQEIDQKKINIDYVDLSYNSPIIKIKQ